MKSHLCNGKWVDGTVRECKEPHGTHNLKSAQRVIMRDGGRSDREAGVIGSDSGDGFYRDGPASR